jgi:hypothetical protein
MSSRITRFGVSSTSYGSDLVIPLHQDQVGGLFQLLFLRLASGPISSLTYGIRGSPQYCTGRVPFGVSSLRKFLFKEQSQSDLVILLRSSGSLPTRLQSRSQVQYDGSPRFGVSSCSYTGDLDILPHQPLIGGLFQLLLQRSTSEPSSRYRRSGVPSTAHFATS